MSKTNVVFIGGKKHPFSSQNEDGSYLLGQGKTLKLTPFENINLRHLTPKVVAKLTFTASGWELQNQGLCGRLIAAITHRRRNSKFHTKKEALSRLWETLGNLSANDKTKIRGVAWFEELKDGPIPAENLADAKRRARFVAAQSRRGVLLPAAASPAADSYTPVLLTDFCVAVIPPPSAGTDRRDESWPDWFTNIKDAAAYAGKTPRTIQNWKKSGWLKSEQQRKKVRIAKADLDKCIARQ